MRRLVQKGMFVLLCGLLGFSASALVEVRVSTGNVAGKPSQLNDAYFAQNDGPEISEQTHLGFDAIVDLPMVPFGFGLRQEGIKEEKTAFNETFDLSITRMSLVLNYRLWDTFFYVGPIATYGLKHDFALAIPTSVEAISSGSASSYTVGIEGGLKLGLFRVGAEIGQYSMTFKDLTEIDGSVVTKNSMTVSELDFSTTYYKLVVGVGF